MAQSTLDVRPAVKAPNKTSLRRDVQGLRALAVLAVIADHLLGYPEGGFVGVDVFFVISGFLITGLLLREQETKGRISFADFYRRRARRIMPVAVIVLAATVAASWLVFSAGRAQTITVDALWALIFGANWHFAAVGTDYMQAEGPVSPLQHFWSLAVEEQFYVVWPWIIVLVLGLLANRMRWQPATARTVLGVVFGFVIVATFTFAYWETATHPTVAYFSTISRTWELGIGALLAVTGGACSKLPSWSRPILAYAGLAGIAWSVAFITPEMAFPAPWAAVPVLATALIIAAGTCGEQRFLAPLTNPVATYLGNISYSLYLWHFPAIIFIAALLPVDGPLYFVAVAATIFTLSAASYHLVEDPIRKSTWLDPRAARSVKQGRRNHPRVSAQLLGLGVLAVVTAIVTGMALANTNPQAAPYSGVKSALGETALLNPSPSPAAADPTTAQITGVSAALEATAWAAAEAVN